MVRLCHSNNSDYRSASNIIDNDITIFKALSAGADVLFMITWLIASAFNKASITDMDLDPEEMDTDIFEDETADSE